MEEVKPSVDIEVATMMDAIAKGAASSMKAVEGGDVDSVFDAGMRMGLTVAIGLATAKAIKERRLRDKYRAAGQGEFYKRHDARAQAFAEMANAMERWNAEHPIKGESEE